MGDGVITAFMALHKLSDMGLLALFNIGMRRAKQQLVIKGAQSILQMLMQPSQPPNTDADE